MGESTHLQHLLDDLNAGSDAARAALLEHSFERIRYLVRRKFPRTSDLRAIDETDDVVSKALMRLHKALESVKPPDLRAYIGLAARQIAWVLRDLARELKTSDRVAFLANPEDAEGAARRDDLNDSFFRVEFHDCIEKLPTEMREMFDMELYQGLTQREAAELLGVPLRTYKRNWQQAKLALHKQLKGNLTD